VWNPARDTLIPQKYSKSSLDKKGKNKSVLQKASGLPVESKIPLIGIVSRVTEQKGFDILIPAIPEMMNLGVQVVLLGTGEAVYQEPLEAFAAAGKGFVAYLKYDEALAHRIYAGSDFFLMPSKFEPCGLGQEISLRYGTIPIVRETGGLADTVVDVDTNPAEGNGFVFTDYKPGALVDTVRRAVETYGKRKGWRDLQRRAMGRDLSWRASAMAYADLYKTARGG